MNTDKCNPSVFICVHLWFLFFVSLCLGGSPVFQSKNSGSIIVHDGAILLIA
jgi:hypothetical protein